MELNRRNMMLAAALKSTGHPGIVHRSPHAVFTTVTVENVENNQVQVFSQVVPFPQFGTVETLDVSVKRFAQSTASVAFGNTGGICRYA